MYEGTVELRQQTCTACGFGPVQPQSNQNYDRFEKVTIIEATWRCPRCTHHFASGIVERIPDEKSVKTAI